MKWLLTFVVCLQCTLYVAGVPSKKVTTEEGLRAALLRNDLEAIESSKDHILGELLTKEMCESDIKGREKSDPKYEALVIYAAAIDGGDLAKRCIELGFKISQPVDSEGGTFMDYPDVILNIAFVKYLLDNGLDPTEPSFDGQNVICLIIEEYDDVPSKEEKQQLLSVLELIMQYSPTPNIRCMDGKTALFNAMNLKLPEIVSILLANKAALNLSMDDEEDTPLYLIKTGVLSHGRDPRVQEMAKLVHENKMRKHKLGLP